MPFLDDSNAVASPPRVRLNIGQSTTAGAPQSLDSEESHLPLVFTSTPPVQSPSVSPAAISNAILRRGGPSVQATPPGQFLSDESPSQEGGFLHTSIKDMGEEDLLAASREFGYRWTNQDYARVKAQQDAASDQMGFLGRLGAAGKAFLDPFAKFLPEVAADKSGLRTVASVEEALPTIGTTFSDMLGAKKLYNLATGTSPFQSWMYDYMRAHPEVTAHPEAYQNLQTMVPGQLLPAEPLPATTQVLSTAGMFLAPEAAAGVASRVAKLSALAPITGAEAAVAGRVGAAVEKAKAAYEATKLGQAVPVGTVATAFPRVQAVAAAVPEMGAKAMAAVGRGVTKVGELPEKIVEAAANRIFGPELAEKIGAYTRLGEGGGTITALLTGEPRAWLAAIPTGLKASGRLTQSIGDFMTRLAETDPTSPFGRLWQVARDPSAPGWQRGLAAWRGTRLAAGAADLAEAAAKGAVGGAVFGAAYSAVSGDDLASTLGTTMSFGVMGGLGYRGRLKASEMMSKNLQRWDAWDKANTAEAKTPEAQLATDKAMGKVGVDALQYATTMEEILQSTHPGVKVRMAPEGPDSPLPQSAYGQAGIWLEKGDPASPDPSVPQFWVNLSAGRPVLDTLMHEGMHPLYDSVVANRPELKQEIDDVLKQNNLDINAMKSQYAALELSQGQNVAVSPALIAEKVAARDAQNPNWIYSEILAEAGVQAMSGRSLVGPVIPHPYLRGQAIQAGIEALQKMGITFNERPAKLGGPRSLFPGFENVIDSPILRQRVLKLIQAARDYRPSITAPVEQKVSPKPEDIGNHPAFPAKGPPGQRTVMDIFKEVAGSPGKFERLPDRVIRRFFRSRMQELFDLYPEFKKPTQPPLDPGDPSPQMAWRRKRDGSLIFAGRDLRKLVDQATTWGPETKDFILAMQQWMDSGLPFKAWYNQLGEHGEDRTVSIPKTLGDIKTQFKDQLYPMQFVITKNGNLMVDSFDMGAAFNTKLQRWAGRTGEVSLELWGGNQADFTKDVQTYLQNQREGKPGDAGIGAAKRDVINAFLVGGHRALEAKNPLRPLLKGTEREGLVRSYRLDRLETAAPAEPTFAQGVYERQALNLSPETRAAERELPPVEEGKVRLFSGSGGAAGAGTGGSFFSRSLDRAASYTGETGNVAYVDVPKEVFEAGQAEALRQGSGTSGDAVLPNEWVNQAQPMPRKVRAPLFLLSPELRPELKEDFDRSKFQGGDVSQPIPTYARSREVQGNPWVRRSKDPANTQAPTNAGRTLMMQFASDLLYKNATGGPDPTAGAYFDKLYSGAREGYARMQDFWEIPQWMGFVSHFVPDADMYVVRDMAEASNFIKAAGYDRVLYSALDLNRENIKQLVTENPQQHFDIGGYTDPKFFDGLANANWHNTMKDFADFAGVPYAYGVDYRHFEGSDVIPRLTLSSGCKHKCAFCTIEKDLKLVPREVIEQQADAIAGLGSKLVYLNDKTFGQAGNYTMLPDLYKRMLKINPEFKGFVIQTTAAQMSRFTPEYLKDSGIKFVELGVESYNDPILHALHKPATEAVIDKAVDKLRQANIAFIPNIVIGFPGETAETYSRTLDFLKRNSDIISHANIYNLAVYENTELGKQLTTASPDDFNENVLEKSFHTDQRIHRVFAGDLYGLASRQLEQHREGAFSPDTEGWIGTAQRDEDGSLEIFANRGKLGRTGHERMGMPGDPNNWRYNPDTQTVYWWKKPPVQTQQQVTDWLDAKGEKVKEHRSLIGPTGMMTHDNYWMAHGEMEKAQQEAFSPNPGYIGMVTQDLKVNSESVDSLSDRSKTHFAFGMWGAASEGDVNWRYNPRLHTVYAWDPLTRKQRDEVYAYLQKKGEDPRQTKIISAFGSTFTESHDLSPDIASPGHLGLVGEEGRVVGTPADIARDEHGYYISTKAAPNRDRMLQGAKELKAEGRWPTAWRYNPAFQTVYTWGPVNEVQKDGIVDYLQSHGEEPIQFNLIVPSGQSMMRSHGSRYSPQPSDPGAPPHINDQTELWPEADPALLAAFSADIKRDKLGRPLLPSGELDLARWQNEAEQQRRQREAEFEKADLSRYQAAGGKPTKGPSVWILPTGKTADVGAGQHEQILGARAKEFNEQFGTSFSGGDLQTERIDALNHGFVRVRMSNLNRLQFELNENFWDAQKKNILAHIEKYADQAAQANIHLLNSKGDIVQQVGAHLLDEDKRQANIQSMIESVKPPVAEGTTAKGPTKYQQAQAFGEPPTLSAQPLREPDQPSPLRPQLVRDVNYQPTPQEWQDVKTIADALRKGGWSIITGTQEKNGTGTSPENQAANAKLEAELQQLNAKVDRLIGMYKGVPQGTSFLIHGMPREQVREIAQRYGQESVLFPEGYVFNDNTLVRANHAKDKFGPAAEKEEGYSTLPNGLSFSVGGLDFDRREPYEPKLYVIRHGDTAFNEAKDEKVRGWIDVELTGDGREEAEQAAHKLKGKGIGVVVTSDLVRAAETAHIIAKAIGADLHVMPGLRPWDLGELQGKKTKEVSGLMDYFAKHPAETVPGGESFDAYKDRFINTIKEIEQTHQGNVAVVTHYRGQNVLDAWDHNGRLGTEIDAKRFLDKTVGSTSPGGIMEVRRNVGPADATLSPQPEQREFPIKGSETPLMVPRKNIKNLGMVAPRGQELTPTERRASELALKELQTKPQILPTPGKESTQQHFRALEKGIETVNKALKKQAETVDFDTGEEWYRKDIEDMENSVKTIFPQTAETPSKMGMFKLVLAILSQQEKPMRNFSNAGEMFDQYLSTGELQKLSKVRLSETGEGKQLGMGAEQAAKINALLKEKGGEEGLINYLTTKDPATGEWGAYVLGPKIGRFFLNVMGFANEVTIDLWMMRQWNRWMGTPFRVKGERSAEAGKSFEDQVPNEVQRRLMIFTYTKIAEEISKATGKNYTPMQIQAMLWYHEKDLYADLRKDEERPSFASAAKAYEKAPLHKQEPRVVRDGPKKVENPAQEHLSLSPQPSQHFVGERRGEFIVFHKPASGKFRVVSTGHKSRDEALAKRAELDAATNPQ